MCVYVCIYKYKSDEIVAARNKDFTVPDDFDDHDDDSSRTLVMMKCQ